MAPNPPNPREPEAPPRAGRCAIVGRPNVGKSTLLNALVGQKLAIATPKPGTTRSRILGVFSRATPATQIAFLDTPGMHRPKSALGKVLVEEASLGLADADVVLLVTEVPGKEPRGEIDARDEVVIAEARGAGKPIVVAVNKVDRLRDKRWLLPVLDAYQRAVEPAAIVPISALAGTSLDRLLDELRTQLPEGKLYDDDFLTDRPERFFVAELVREAVLRQIHDEVPYGVAVVVEGFTDEGKFVRIQATLIVEKDSHKGIVLGKGGARIKSIGIEARKEIEAFLERHVHLELFVRVEPGWTDRPDLVRRLATEAMPK